MTVTSNDKTQVEKAEETVTLTIDGIEVTVPKGTLTIRAAEMIGVAVPRFCDHPLLDPVGACRQCLVEVPDDGRGRPMPKPQASCTLEAMPGMQIKTQVSSPVAEKAQAGMMEFLLMNHPLDCPICDKGGECPLQNQAMSNGSGESRYEGVKRTYPKPINLSAQVLLDRERCVLCARCTRFSEQIAGDPFIALVERGALQQVGIYEDEPFESYFSGNTIQICPVGALTSAAYRFRSRPFDLISTTTSCEHCASGCELRVDQRRGTVMRRLAGNDPQVNEEWNCDKGRFAFMSGRGDDRITRPLVREGDQLREASWGEAIDAAVAGLKAADSTGVLTGGRLTVEDSYAYSKFARLVLGTNNIDFRSRPHSAEEEAFLGGAVAGVDSGVDYAALEKAKRVHLVCFEPEDESPIVFLRLRKAFRKSKTKVFSVSAGLSRGSEKMGAQLVPTVPGTEAQVLNSLQLDADDIVLVGERAATSPGALTAVAEVTRAAGARLAWVPRRAGDRGAVEAGCLPNLLPGGRPVVDARARVDVISTWGSRDLPAEPGLSATTMLEAAAHGELGALLVAGVDPADFESHDRALAGLEEAGFVISLENRLSEVSERADVVFPVSLLEEREGTFRNWENRERIVAPVVPANNVMSDLRVLAALSDAMGSDLGVRSAEQARAELAELGAWRGNRVAMPHEAPATALEPVEGEAVLASWRELLDDARALDGETELRATARKPVVRMNQRMAGPLTDGDLVSITRDGDGLVLPLEIREEMIDSVVWVAQQTGGNRASNTLQAVPGDLVRIAPAYPVDDSRLPSAHSTSSNDAQAGAAR